MPGSAGFQVVHRRISGEKRATVNRKPPNFKKQPPGPRSNHRVKRAGIRDLQTLSRSQLRLWTEGECFSPAALRAPAEANAPGARQRRAAGSSRRQPRNLQHLLRHLDLDLFPVQVRDLVQYPHRVSLLLCQLAAQRFQ